MTEQQQAIALSFAASVPETLVVALGFNVSGTVVIVSTVRWPND